MAAAVARYRSMPESVKENIMIYLLQQIAGNVETPSQLIQSARGYEKIAAGMHEPIIAYLLCEIANL